MIYFIQADIIGRIKIGYTSQAKAEQRISNIQTGCPVPIKILATIPGSRAKEEMLHNRFAFDRVIGEWFNPSQALIRFIARIQGHPRRERVQTIRRSDRAETFLVECFKSNLEWSSELLFEAARAKGLGRNAIYEAKVKLNIPKPRRIKKADCVSWWWWVPSDWPWLATEATVASPDDDATVQTATFS